MNFFFLNSAYYNDQSYIYSVQSYHTIWQWHSSFFVFKTFLLFKKFCSQVFYTFCFWWCKIENYKVVKLSKIVLSVECRALKEDGRFFCRKFFFFFAPSISCLNFFYIQLRYLEVRVTWRDLSSKLKYTYCTDTSMHWLSRRKKKIKYYIYKNNRLVWFTVRFIYLLCLRI